MVNWALAIAVVGIGSAALAAETVTYTYDVHGRLVRTSHASSTTTNNGKKTLYCQDKADNRTKVVTAGGTPTC